MMPSSSTLPTEESASITTSRSSENNINNNIIQTTTNNNATSSTTTMLERSLMLWYHELPEAKKKELEIADAFEKPSPNGKTKESNMKMKTRESDEPPEETFRQRRERELLDIGDNVDDEEYEEGIDRSLDDCPGAFNVGSNGINQYNREEALPNQEESMKILPKHVSQKADEITAAIIVDEEALRKELVGDVVQAEIVTQEEERKNPWCRCEYICAIIMVVRFCIIFSKAACTNFSDAESSAEVASSSMTRLGVFTKTRPKANRCCSPSDNVLLQSRTVESPLIGSPSPTREASSPRSTLSNISNSSSSVKKFRLISR